MTWADFKRQMEAHGVADSDVLLYVTLDWPEAIVVERWEDGLAIYNGGTPPEHKTEGPLEKDLDDEIPF